MATSAIKSREHLALKSQYMSTLVRKIRVVCRMTSVRRGTGRRAKAGAKTRALVDEFNALAMPKSWIGIDGEGHIHLTRLASACSDRSHGSYPSENIVRSISSMMVLHEVDFCWDLNGDGSYTCTKDRTGDFLRPAKDVDTKGPFSDFHKLFSEAK